MVIIFPGFDNSYNGTNEKKTEDPNSEKNIINTLLMLFGYKVVSYEWKQLLL